MVYVEWLRVRGCLKWCAIVLGILFLIVAILRIALAIGYNGERLVDNMKSDPGTRFSTMILPDGTRRTIVDDPLKKVHAVIDDRGSLGRHIEILDRSGSHVCYTCSNVTHGSAQTFHRPGGSFTVIDTGQPQVTPLLDFVKVGAFLALIVATVLGAPFARENDGHLEISLTKPVDRTLLALQTIGVDVAGIVASLAIGVVFAICSSVLFDIPSITFGNRDAFALAVGILAPIAWYAMLTAATTSMKRGYGAVVGFAWPVAAIVVGLGLLPSEGNALLAIIHSAARTLSYIDPVAYMNVGGDQRVTINGESAAVYSSRSAQVLMLAALSLLYSALAIFQWRRTEA